MKTKLYRICEWIDYLRANPEKQGQRKLHILQDDKMCCLGALCFLNQDLVKKELEYGYFSYTWIDKGMEDRDIAGLPEGFKDFLHLNNFLGDNVLSATNGFSVNLATANDAGKSWPEIADFIENNPEAIFNDDKLIAQLKEVSGRRKLPNHQTMLEAYHSIYTDRSYTLL